MSVYKKLKRWCCIFHRCSTRNTETNIQEDLQQYKRPHITVFFLKHVVA